MASNHNSTYQYEPLPVPSHWSREERQFAQRLIDVLDDIYLKWGRISEKELSNTLRTKINNKVDGSALEQYSTIEQTAEAIKTEVSKVETTVQTVQTGLNETNQSVQEVQTGLNETNQNVQQIETRLENYSTIEQTADKIEAAVSQIQIGGRNLLLGTTSPLAASASGSMGSYERASGDSLAGETIQLHFDFTIEGGGSASLTVNLGSTPVTFPLSGAENHARAVGKLTSDDWTAAEFVLSDPTGLVTISHVQLETGSTPTQWGQADGELIAGSDVEITKDNVRISTPRFSVGYGGDEYMALDMNGGYFPRLSSPQVQPMYDGPATIYVNSGSVDGKTYFASLPDALAAVNGCCLPYNVTIQVTAYSEYSEVVISGICGSGALVIQGGGMTLYNQLYINQCSSLIYVAQVTVTHTSEAVWISLCSYVRLLNCAFETSGTTVEVVKVTGGSKARLEGTSMMGGNYSVRAWYNSIVSVYNCSGNKNMCVHASFLFGSGTMPCSKTDLVYTYYEQGLARISGTVDQGSGSTDAPSTTTTTVLARATGYHQSVWNYGSGYFYQGITSPYGTITGCMWFDLSDLSGKTVTAAKLRLSRVSGYGSNTTVDVRLMGLGSGCTGVNTTLSRTKDYGVIGALPPGATRHFTLPVAAVQDLINGTTGGLCLYSQDTAVQTGLNYSANYARFYGTAGDDNTKPRLSITV